MLWSRDLLDHEEVQIPACEPDRMPEIVLWRGKHFVHRFNNQYREGDVVEAVTDKED